MDYLISLPGFIFACLLAWSDLRTRKVPRRFVCIGLAVEGMVQILVSLGQKDPVPLVASFGLCLSSTLLQFILALIRPGALGFGDVTATALVALSLGPLGFTTIIIWWLLMGILGLLALAVQALISSHPGKEEGLPFVPVILVAGLAALGFRMLLLNSPGTI